MQELVDRAKSSREVPTKEVIEHILEDEQGLPGAINNMVGEDNDTCTLFGIVMDLKEAGGEAWVRLGRPTENGERIHFKLGNA